MDREKCICRFQGAVTAQKKQKSRTNYLSDAQSWKQKGFTYKGEEAEKWGEGQQKLQFMGYIIICVILPICPNKREREGE